MPRQHHPHSSPWLWLCLAVALASSSSAESTTGSTAVTASNQPLMAAIDTKNKLPPPPPPPPPKQSSRQPRMPPPPPPQDKGDKAEQQERPKDEKAESDAPIKKPQPPPPRPVSTRIEKEETVADLHIDKTVASASESGAPKKKPQPPPPRPVSRRIEKEETIADLPIDKTVASAPEQQEERAAPQKRPPPPPPSKVNANTRPESSFDEASRPEVSQRDPPPQRNVGGASRVVVPQQDNVVRRPQPSQYESRNAQIPARQKYPSSARRISTTVPSFSFAAKSVWNRLERGLDRLADMEETITEKASQLFVLPTIASQDDKESDFVPDSSRPPVIRRRHSKKTSQQPKPTNLPLRPYGNKFANAIKERDQTAGTTLSTTQGTTSNTSPRAAPWTTTDSRMRPIGGASEPSSGNARMPPPPPVGTRDGPSPQEIPQEPNQEHSAGIRTVGSSASASATAPKSSYSEMTTGRNPYAMIQEKQKQQQQPAPGRSSTTSSRIPWSQTPTAISQQKPAPKVKETQKAYSFEVDEKVSLLSRLSGLVPNPMRLFRKKDSYHGNLDMWIATEEAENKVKKRGFFARLFSRNGNSKDGLQDGQRFSHVPSSAASDAFAPPLENLMKRCQDGKTASLCTDSDKAVAHVMGQRRALLDVACLLCILLGIKSMPSVASIPYRYGWTATEIASQTIPALSQVLADSLLSWAPFVFAVAYMLFLTNITWFGPEGPAIASDVADQAGRETRYGQLYLRLVAGSPVDPSLSDRVKDAASCQIRSAMASARLRSFIRSVAALFIVTSVLVLRPVAGVLWEGIISTVQILASQRWPVDWTRLALELRAIGQRDLVQIEGLLAKSANAMLDNPVKFVFQLSVFASLTVLWFLPQLEKKRKVVPDEDPEDEVIPSPLESMEQLSKVGASSANRLSLLSEEGSIENVLERWRLIHWTPAVGEGLGEGSSEPILLRMFGLRVIALVATVAPLVVSVLLGTQPGGPWQFLPPSVQPTSSSLIRWDAISDVCLLMAFAFWLTWNAIGKAVVSMSARPAVKSFLTTLASTMAEVRNSRNKQRLQQTFLASISPSAGIQVRDLWAAHTSKRAWAIRGAHLHCPNGQVLVVLGDDGAGKSRLLTSIAESIIDPPKRSLTTNKVRGSISVAGVDVSKWDRKMLQSRTGILLSDVRTIADTASLMSGLSLAEILEPVDGLRSLDSSYKPNASDRAAMILALKITGLYHTLLPKLPSKLATIITANEEDLRPSPLRPRCSVLSPAEWSKLLLARVLAQTIADNDNSAASSDKIENSLIGSTLILDDPTVLLTETEEAKLFSDLQKTGAATILSTNKWATGRFGDQIAVVKDGAVVEVGTHNELLSRGPQQSLYAAKWHAMTTQ